MDKTLSRLTYSFFFVLFIILAPILTMYSLGYRYDFNTGTIEKNGAFYVKSFPRDANIYVDDILSGHQTPSQVTNVKPGLHVLKVNKEDYEPWQKELEVHSGETTFAEDVVLFLAERPKTILSAGSENFLVNRHSDKYAYLDNQNQLVITDVEQAKNFAVYDFDQAYELIDWSEDNKKLILKDAADFYYVFNIDQRELERLSIKSFTKILWENNSDTVLYLKQNNLFRMNLAQINNPTIDALELTYPINDFALEDNDLIIQYTLEQNNYLEILDKNSLESKQTIPDINLGKLDVLKLDNDRIIFTLGSKLYIKNNWQDLITIPITLARIHDDRLLISNGHEIILYNYKDNWQDLIDRSSQIVSDVLWHPNGSYFISEINDQTNIVEIDGRDKRNMLNLLNNPRKKMYLFNKKGDRLFILTPEENFYLTIQ